MFYSKLTKELKKQFKISNILIPNTRAQCIVIAQCIQEGLYKLDNRKGLYRSNKKKGFVDKPNLTIGLKYPYISSKRDYKD